MNDQILSSRGRRARAGLHDGLGRPEATASPSGPDGALLDELRRRLLGGETHYPVRPGMTELRARVAGLLAQAGLPERGPDSVVITASEGEALFATLIAAGAFESGSIEGSVPDRHAALFHWMGITATGARAADGSFDRFTVGDFGEVVLIGNALVAEAGELGDAASAALLVGSLTGVDGVGSFSLGFAAGDPSVVAQVTKWKQASSICSPGPSQRALLWALGGDE